MDIKLNFINKAQDGGKTNGGIFQKVLPRGTGDRPIAWLVIEHCGEGDNHPFTFPSQLAVNANDADGNYTPQTLAQAGQVFQMVKTSTGDQLQFAGDGV